MDLHNLKPTTKRKVRKRVGRGNGNNWGRTCGRGEKGQMSRSGATHRPHFEGGQIPLIRRLPKYGFKSRNHTTYAVVNVCDLEKHFEAGEEVDFLTLAQKGMIGNLDDGLNLRGGTLIAADMINNPREFLACRKLMATLPEVDADKLADPDLPLASLTPKN